MKLASFLSTALATSAALFAAPASAADASAVDPLVIKGKQFFYKTNGTQFSIRGIAYQPDYSTNATQTSNAGYTDPLADTSACERDIPYLVQLRTNVIRTYAVDPSNDHSGCMNALANAGIYVLTDLESPDPNEYIDRNTPAWNYVIFERYMAMIDEFQQYNNVLGFFAGNEVTNSVNTTAASAYVKAAIRDSKMYIKNQAYRTIGVGFASYDGPVRDDLADFFNCGDAAAATDFWGYNIYSWCGDATYSSSQYEARTQFFQDFSVPAFFAEYGCNQGLSSEFARPFTEVDALYGTSMAPVWAGGIVYEYFNNENNYGLVTVSGNSVSKEPDFASLSAKLATATPSLTSAAAYTSTGLAAASCPTVGASWSAMASPLPPTPNADLCSCVVDTFGCVVRDSTPETSYGDLFSYICGRDNTACDGIASNATTGSYGAYSVCSSKQQLSFVMNQWYLGHGSTGTACDFSGNATTQSAASAQGSCSSLIAAAGTNGAGTVAAPTGKATQYASAASGGANAAATSSGGAAQGMTVGSVEFGMVQVGLYAFVAVMTAAGMVLL